MGETILLFFDASSGIEHFKVVVAYILGYIPAFYSGWMIEIIEKNSKFKVAINKIHSQAVPHRKVNIIITGEVNQFVNIDEVLNDEKQLRLVMC